QPFNRAAKGTAKSNRTWSLILGSSSQKQPPFDSIGKSPDDLATSSNEAALLLVHDLQSITLGKFAAFVWLFDCVVFVINFEVVVDKVFSRGHGYDRFPAIAHYGSRAHGIRVHPDHHVGSEALGTDGFLARVPGEFNRVKAIGI